VDLVRIDAIYNPVRRANFRVEETRVGQRTDFDRLTLSVETDGSVDPEDAVGYAAELLQKHFEYLLYFGSGGIPVKAPPGAVPVPERLRDVFTRPIEDLAELSVRSRNSLQKENIRTLGDLVQKTEDEMLEIENFGKKSLKEIADFLEEQSLRFGMEIEEGDDGELYFVEEVTDEAEEPVEHPINRLEDRCGIVRRAGSFPEARVTRRRRSGTWPRACSATSGYGPPRPRPRSSVRTPRSSSPGRRRTACTPGARWAGRSPTGRSSGSSSTTSDRVLRTARVATPGS